MASMQATNGYQAKVLALRALQESLDNAAEQIDRLDSMIPSEECTAKAMLGRLAVNLIKSQVSANCLADIYLPQ
jgi:hypothetical protein